MKIKILIVFIIICGIVKGQNPTADFRCTFYSFDTTSYQCCIAFEDFSSDSDGSVISQVWDYGDPASGNLNTSTAHFNFHCYSTIGSYTVTFSVIDNVSNVDTLRAINCIVVDSSGCYCNHTTNITDVTGDGFLFQIYPNPTTNTFSLKYISSKEKMFLQIINSIGELIYTEILFGRSEYVINSNLSSGIYFVKVSQGGKTFAKKVVVE